MNVVATAGSTPAHTHTSSLAVWLAKHIVRCVDQDSAMAGISIVVSFYSYMYIVQLNLSWLQL